MLTAPFLQVKAALPALARLIHSQDEEVLTDACWALSYLSDGTNDKIQARGGSWAGRLQAAGIMGHSSAEHAPAPPLLRMLLAPLLSGGMCVVTFCCCCAPVACRRRSLTAGCAAASWSCCCEWAPCWLHGLLLVAWLRCGSACAACAACEPPACGLLPPRPM